MTGPEHYTKAEELLGVIDGIPDPNGDGANACRQAATEAQVHATLAQAASHAMAYGDVMPREQWAAWLTAAGKDPAQ